MTIQVAVKSYFKKVSEKAGTNPRAGQKRKDLDWSFEGVSPEEVSSLEPQKVSALVNAMIEAFGRKKIAEAGDNWEFVPTGINLDSTYLDLVSVVTKSRLITKESLQKLGAFYEKASKALMGVSIPAAQTGNRLISERFKSIAGKNDVLKVMQNRLLGLVEACSDSEIDSFSDEIVDFADLIEALIQEIETLMAVEVTADAL